MLLNDLRRDGVLPPARATAGAAETTEGRALMRFIPRGPLPRRRARAINAARVATS